MAVAGWNRTIVSLVRRGHVDEGFWGVLTRTVEFGRRGTAVSMVFCGEKSLGERGMGEKKCFLLSNLKGWELEVKGV